MPNPELVIVTGAAKGIGHAITARLIKEGCEVIACDFDQTAIEEARASFRSTSIEFFKVDVRSHLEVQQFFDDLSKRSKFPTGLVNNAGVFAGKGFLDYEVSEIERVMATNLLGPIYFSQNFGRLITNKRAKGVIVNIASIAGQIGSSDAIYGVTKSGVIGLTKTTAISFAPDIRVNAVAPGIVETELQKSVPKERLDVFRKGELLKEEILPEDVADSVWFLLSDQSKHYTGAVLDINNGFAMR